MALWPRRFSSGSNETKASSNVRTFMRPFSSAGLLSRHLARVHGHQPVELLSLLHVGGGHEHAHPRAPLPDPINEVPELPARQRINPVVGSSRINRSGSWISEQHKPSFCFMPPDNFPLRGGPETASTPCFAAGL